MNNKQLPPLPTLQPGDSHMESLIEAAIQGHADTRDAMRWLVRQLVPATQPAEVSDAELLDAYNSIDPCNESPQDRLIRRLRTILALRPVQSTFCEYCGGNDEEPVDHCMDCTRPVQVPMTREQAMAIVQSNPDTMTAIRMTEAHHGITAQAKKEAP